MRNAEPRIRIVLADDHAMFREALRRLLESNEKYSVVAEAADGAEVLDLLRQHKPDLLLIDLHMPGQTGMETLRRIRKSGLPQRTIVVAAAATREQITEAVSCGARGVVSKESATKVLFASIEAVIKGEYWIGRDAVADILDYMREIEDRTKENRRRFSLSEREIQVIQAVAQGCSNKEVANALGISEDTVKRHLSRIFDKTGVSSRLELALFAQNHGVGKTPSPH